jgi:hypothetical protein
MGPNGSAGRGGPVGPLSSQLRPPPEGVLLVAGEIAWNGDGDDYVEVTPRPTTEMSDAQARLPKSGAWLSPCRDL